MIIPWFLPLRSSRMSPKKWGALAPHSWRHIRSWGADAPGATVIEYLMWSDSASHVRDSSWRRARFLNTHARLGEAGTEMALVVRWAFHQVDADFDLRGTPVGLAVDGELAALLSLATGARVRSGGVIRRFNPGSDPLGIPNMSISRPAWLEAGPYGSLIPTRPPLEEDDILSLFEIYAAADEETAATLATVAREYSSALWIADADADLAWLLLVSALETVAEAYRQTAKPDPSDVLRETMPAVADLCEPLGREHLEGVAKALKGLTGSTRRFLDFVERFDPGPPEVRPETYGRLDWDNLRETMKKIYQLRSERLHAGVPFPAPMRAAPLSHWTARCEAEIPPDGPAPAHLKDPNRQPDLTPVERPTDTSLARPYQGQWLPEDAPMHLHAFADLTRRTLLRWAQETIRMPVA